MIMLASTLIEVLNKSKRLFGDKNVLFRGVTRGILFEEDIQHISIVTNNSKEPFILFGDSANKIKEEQLIYLNKFGRLIKRFIIQK